MKRTIAILLVLMMGLLTACAVPPKTEADVTDIDAVNAAAVRQTEADTKADLTQDVTAQQEVDAEIEKAVTADMLDRLEQDAAEDEAARLNEAYESVLAEINAMLG